MPAADARYAPLKARSVKYLNEPPWPPSSLMGNYHRVRPESEIPDVVDYAAREMYPFEGNSLEPLILRIIRDFRREEKAYAKMLDTPMSTQW